ncbi:winged helix-turn-helix domain-containing protein [Aquincola sp. S2]|uniref:Winged helix-turn-helix domain-containing protein n=1 Tax=Pseudaquabacterium terrae TaxID=2732868 RepID=A0ABX2EIJ4_9BURK|nr:winged helix-turn-helix domain-containing protein [Aquabacterium terrae]NRF68428.1 winged helix-turn-helix domain-containing protein [Aquabacterium terrae]
MYATMAGTVSSIDATGPPGRCIGLASDDAAAAAAWRGALAAEGLRVCDWVLGDGGGPAAPAPDALVLHLVHGVARQLGPLRALAARQPAVPIVVACRALRDLDHVLALEMGADDVFDAALDAAVAAARLRALWRRGARLGVAAAPLAPPDELRVGRLVLRWRERCALQDERPLDLTEGEFELLWRLALRAGQVVTRRELLRELRGLVDSGPDRSIDSRVYRLRAKLGDRGDGAQRIRTIRNCGYLLAPLADGTAAAAGAH